MRKFLFGVMLALGVVFISGTEASAQGPLRRLFNRVVHPQVNYSHSSYSVKSYSKGCGCSNTNCNNNCTACPTGQCPTKVTSGIVIKQSTTCPNGVCPVK